MKKKYPNLMMQSASSYDTSKVKETVAQQVKEEQAAETAPIIKNDHTETTEPVAAISNNIVEHTPIANDVPAPNPPTVTTVTATTTTVTTTRADKPRLRQQAYYLTEIEIKTIKRLSYELDIPKSDLVRKFIDEGIARIDKGPGNNS